MLQTAHEPETTTVSPRERRAKLANTTWGKILRYAGLVIGIVVGWNAGVRLRPDEAGVDELGYPLVMAASLGALLFLLTPYLTIGVFSILREEFRRIEASDLTAGAFGLLIGGIISALLALPIALLPSPFGQFLPVISAIAICSVSVLAAVTKKRELMDLFGISRRSNISASEQAELQPAKEELLLDTSAIIDGRIGGLASRGFLPFKLVVPQFVLRELQLVADSDDYSRRVRGTRGLQALEEMRSSDLVDLDVRNLDAPGENVDAQLVELARETGTPIFSGDTNLERVATLQGVRVLNLHRLAELMRPALTVGDTIQLKIIQPGREYRQGVGFLDDGTMVVVDEGETLIGSEASVTITRTLQTNSGRMMFARVEDHGDTS